MKTDHVVYTITILKSQRGQEENNFKV